MRGDFYGVTTEATPGYDVTPVVAGAKPAIDPATLPNRERRRTTRATSLTGDIGVVANPGGRVNPFVRFGRSYRHPNLEEMLFAGPATAGSIAPNVTVKPETGNNFDTGAKFRSRTRVGRRLLLRQPVPELHRPGPGRRGDFRPGPLAQATNYADVRITGVELSADAPIAVGARSADAGTARRRSRAARSPKA